MVYCFSGMWGSLPCRQKDVFTALFLSSPSVAILFQREYLMKEEKTFPSVEELEKELKREQYKQKYRLSMKSTLFTLITVAAVDIVAPGA